MSKTKITVIANRLLIEEKVFEEKTKGGIVLPKDRLEEYQAMSTEGTIVAMGDTCFAGCKILGRPQVGDVVYFQKYDGIGKKYGGKDYRILPDDCIFGFSKRYVESAEDLIDA